MCSAPPERTRCQSCWKSWTGPRALFSTGSAVPASFPSRKRAKTTENPVCSRLDQGCFNHRHLEFPHQGWNISMSEPISYSIVIPVFNEEAVLPVLLRRLELLFARFDKPAEVIFVDDGSSDSSPIVLQALARRDLRFRYIGLSRNFGHQIAITAGMDAARGQAIIVMDADLQDPPEVVEQMIAKWQEGYDVVYARRLSRAGESHFKRATAHLFYRMLGMITSVGIPADVGDFRLIDRKVLDVLRQMPEQDRFVRGMIAWLGFRQTEVA